MKSHVPPSMRPSQIELTLQSCDGTEKTQQSDINWVYNCFT